MRFFNGRIVADVLAAPKYVRFSQGPLSMAYTLWRCARRCLTGTEKSLFLEMPCRNPISLRRACNLLSDKTKSDQDRYQKRKYVFLTIFIYADSYKVIKWYFLEVPL